MENCNVCKHKSIDILKGGFLCKIHGPVLRISICKAFEKDETKLKVRKCKECIFFRISKNVDIIDSTNEDDEYLGTCLKYLLREFDGFSRNSCSQFIGKISENITNLE